MAIDYRTGSSYASSSSGTATTIPTPIGMFTSDRMIALVGTIGANPAVSAPTGWSLLGALSHSSGVLRVAAYWRDPQASEPGSYTWTWASSGRNCGAILAYSGVDLAVDPVADFVEGDNSDDGPFATPAQTLAAGDWLISAALSRENPGTATSITWTDSDGADAKRFDLTASNTGTGAQLGAGIFDSDRALAAAAHSRNLTANKTMAQTTALSIRMSPLAEPPAATGGWAFGLPIR